MTVYVDDMRAPFGKPGLYRRRMIMCHMQADTHAELVQMAVRIGVAEKWIQKPGAKYEHFDVCRAARDKAVKYGAVEVTQRELVMALRDRADENTPLGFPGPAQMELMK